MIFPFNLQQAFVQEISIFVAWQAQRLAQLVEVAT
jgi:hypothetical protein